MICPRCSSRSIHRSHNTIGCLACGHVLTEPPREPWDTVASAGSAHPGPAVTDTERALWRVAAVR